MRTRSLLCLFLGLVAASCRKAEVPKVEVPSEPVWKEFTSQQDGFAVSFPTPPETQTQDNQYDFGKVTIRSYTSNPRISVFWRVATHNYPEPFASQAKPGRLIELMRDGMAANVQGKAEGIKDLRLDGYPGQEFVVQSRNPVTRTPLTTRVRLYAVNGRVYQVGVIAPPGDKALGEEATQFFNSFRLMKK